MNRVKPILDRLKIVPTDSWITLHKYKKNEQPDNCYYYTFKHNGTTYCVSGDSISLVFSSEKSLAPIYMGYDTNKLEQAIKRIIKKEKK